MANWIFTVTGQRFEGQNVPPEEILEIRFKDKFWGLAERTPNRRNVNKGDKVIFYMGLPHKKFAANATLASDNFELSRREIKKYGHDMDFYRQKFGVRLEDLSIWEKPMSAETLVPNLQFIENKEYWGAYFQGGVRQLSDHDFNMILASRDTSFVEKVKLEEDLESESEFALEGHLEEFLDTNWDQIDFGRRLSRFETEDQTGRQFPAGPWSIDFLCLDDDSDELVVVELKRGKTSDATVGQVLRYLGWVKKNIAKEGQGVRGIIVARKVDEALNCAVSSLNNVEVLTYRVDFKLKPSG